MDTDSRGSVASITRDSLLSFDVLISTLRSASYLHNQCISKKSLSNQRDRLKIWASNTGALQSGNAALDARLRGFTVMKVAITECFEQLEQVISSNMDILQGQQLPVEQTLAEYQELWDSASDDSSDNEDKMNQKTELGRNLVEIASIVSDLFKLSFKLRNPAARLMGPQLLRALSHRQMVSLDEADETAVVDLFSLYTEFDRAHVEETFTQWRLESWRQKALQFPITPDEDVGTETEWADCDLEQFWANNPPGNDAVDMVRWISSQLFGLADALQLIRDLFPSGALAENDHRLQPLHRDLSPGRILCFQTKGITQCVLKIADFGSMQYHDDQAYNQRGSEICTDSAYRAPELLTGGLAPNSDLWSFGCIILHFIVWYHGGWALVNSVSASSSAEGEQGSDDDKSFKSGNLNITRPSLDPQGLTEGDAGGAVIGQDKDVPNIVVLKESIRQEISKFLDQGNSQFTRDIIGLVKRNLLQTDAGSRASCKAVRDYLKELYKKCIESDAYCIGTLQVEGTKDIAGGD
ncbi:meiosis-specific serine/threonine-protein kinase mek1 [Fusarium bulbicola]|nr:meiosis-specific serine/threonine-protein kinase mek1 [Fusarium bulbicola]